MSQDDRRVWFPAKTYGFGWGFPVTWEGWVTVLVYLLLLFGGLRMVPEASSVVLFGYFAAITAALTLICWLKGERPAWRWGKNKDAA